MKPLELSSVAEIWKLAISRLDQELNPLGKDVQVWFPWGKNWRGHDLFGNLPPTELPEELVSNSGQKFAGRTWIPLVICDSTWLISIKLKQGDTQLNSELPPEAKATLNLLGEFVKMEGLLGLSLRILETCAHERNGHWDRVRNLSVAIGRNLKLSPKELFELEIAAMLHDIGKVALPPGLLTENRPLSAAERKQIEGHSKIGAGMIREIPGLNRVAECVLYHHERPDGTGYPKGLREEEIPLVSLIISAADSFDAMTHYRPYASEQTYHQTFQEMVSNSGKFDDRVLWALNEVLRTFGILDVHPGTPSDNIL